MRALVSMLLLAACAHPATTSSPTATERGTISVSHQGQALADARYYEGNFETLWRVVNPFSQPITVTTWDYQLSVGDQLVPTPAPDPPVTVAGHSATVVRLQRHLVFAAFPHHKYVARLKAVIETSQGQRTVEVSATDWVPRPSPAHASIDGLHIDRGAGSVQVSLTIGVSNPNAFWLTFQGLELEVQVSGSRIGRVKIGPQPDLKPGERRPFATKLPVDLMSVGGLAQAALKSTEEMVIGVKGTLAFENEQVAVDVSQLRYPR